MKTIRISDDHQRMLEIIANYEGTYQEKLVEFLIECEYDVHFPTGPVKCKHTKTSAE